MGEAWIIDAVRTPRGRDKKEEALKGPAGIAPEGKPVFALKLTPAISPTH